MGAHNTLADHIKAAAQATKQLREAPDIRRRHVAAAHAGGMSYQDISRELERELSALGIPPVKGDGTGPDNLRKLVTGT